MAFIVSSETGGYDYQFVDTLPDRLVCKICHLPSRDPYLTTCCGHVFCKSCLDDSKPVCKVCPVCCEEEFVAYVNKQLAREVKSLHVMCTSKERGCVWQGELNDINNHLRNNDGCQFEDVKCSNDCGKMLQRRYLTGHVETECPCRNVDCQYCHITGEHQFIEGEHKEQCPKVLLPCPNNCTVNRSICGRKRRAHLRSKVVTCIPREDMEAHRNECPLQEIECFLECGKMLQRRYLTRHVAKECPLRKVDCEYCHTTGQHQFIEGEHKRQCPKFPIPCPNQCGIGSVLGEDMEAHRKECPLEMVQCEYHSVGCKERIMRKRKKKHEEEKIEEHLSLTKCRLATTDKQLSSTQSQLATALKQIDTLMVVVQTLTPSEHTLASYERSFVSLAIRSVKLNALATRIKSGNQVCPVVVNFPELTRRKAGQIEWYSDSFYSHDKGYKMSIRIDAAGEGDDEGTHLSVFLIRMKGPHDDMLKWPLRGKFEFKLLNQISNCEHRTVTVSYDENTDDDLTSRVIDDKVSDGWGLPKFISNEDLHRVTPTCQYVKDDCIFLQVSKR